MTVTATWCRPGRDRQCGSHPSYSVAADCAMVRMQTRKGGYARSMYIGLGTLLIIIIILILVL